MFHLLPVTFHMSPVTNDNRHSQIPSPANSPNMHSRLFCQDKKFCLRETAFIPENPKNLSKSIYLTSQNQFFLVFQF